ncbi:hypothetical protein EV651_10754 [Kribbella sp. VKM Ac-2571]|uniref:hypothetical protein n=1 Tax=Kribbella sp. VKM Ac-2571 TaxID=2512222 RepID=UPI00105BA1CC|nr:hypothetical protein [Kribbella sp. VKM Ac-2571]TDO60782.1 hypothetical protein EV651_10754 [Kribbella sp. VKM Ac-2571]
MTIDISGSNVRQTVRFDRPIKGKDLIDAVRATCAAKGSDFSETKRYDDGWLHAVGQSSHAEQQQLLVAPDRDNAFIKPDKTYTEAVVLRHNFPRAGTRTLARNDFDVEDEVREVIEFADALQRTVQHGPDAGKAMSRGLDAGGPEVRAGNSPEWGRREGSGYRPGGHRDLGR